MIRYHDNVKLTFVNSRTNQTVHSFRTKQKNVIRLSIKILDSNSIYDWAHKHIELIEKKYVLDKFVCTAHGTSIALIGHDNQELLACTDYEYKFDKFVDKGSAIAALLPAPIQISPILPVGIHSPS